MSIDCQVGCINLTECLKDSFFSSEFCIAGAAFVNPNITTVIVELLSQPTAACCLKDGAGNGNLFLNQDGVDEPSCRLSSLPFTNVPTLTPT